MSEPLANRIFYRLVRTNPPAREDFLSYKELGIGPARVDEESLRLSTGISVFRTEAQARRLSRRRGFRRTYHIAEIRVPPDVDARVERTTGSPGHLRCGPMQIGLRHGSLGSFQSGRGLIMKIFELWDSRSNNLVATFDSEFEALHVIAQVLREQGEDVVEPLELLWDDEEQDEHGVVAYGQSLVDLAKSAA